MIKIPFKNPWYSVITILVYFVFVFGAMWVMDLWSKRELDNNNKKKKKR